MKISMDLCNFSMDSSKIWYGTLYRFVWIHDLCMDFGKILSKNLLRYGLLGFSLDIKLVPLSRVLLGRHLNSRFKGSLVEKP